MPDDELDDLPDPGKLEMRSRPEAGTLREGTRQMETPEVPGQREPPPEPPDPGKSEPRTPPPRDDDA
jgi:hypothetical protein